jgi:hypothetical protein
VDTMDDDGLQRMAKTRRCGPPERRGRRDGDGVQRMSLAEDVDSRGLAPSEDVDGRG